MIKNTYQSWKTTTIGLVITAAALASVFIGQGVTWTNAAVGIVIGLSLVFAPDDIITRLKTFLSVLLKTTDETTVPPSVAAPPSGSV